MLKLALLRHGQSQWNLENRFTGWTDVDISAQGVEEAQQASRLFKQEGFVFDVAYTSLLKRAIRTLWITLDGLDLLWIPVHKSWRLNERHYGGLQGLNKAETVTRHGAEQVQIWRRSYDIPPPPLAPADAERLAAEPRYADIPRAQLPQTESLKDTVARFLPYWFDTVTPLLRARQRVLICAHGNSLRALVKHLDNVSDKDIAELNIPTGIPLIYELDQDLKAKNRYYLGDPEAARRAAESVAKQTETKG